MCAQGQVSVVQSLHFGERAAGTARERAMTPHAAWLTVPFQSLTNLHTLGIVEASDHIVLFVG